MNNAFGLDADYFIRLFARELNPDVVRNQTPDCLARVLARAARTACAEVLAEPEFQQTTLAQPVADEQGEQQPAVWATHPKGAAVDADCGLVAEEEAKSYAPGCVTPLYAAPVAQAAPQPCACRTPEAAATRQKDEAEAVKLQRILFDRHMDCRPADTGLMGWAAAVLSAPQPEQSGLVEAHALLKAAAGYATKMEPMTAKLLNRIDAWLDRYPPSAYRAQQGGEA